MVNIGSRCCNKFFPKMYELYGKRNLPGFWWVELIQSTQLCQLYFKCKRFMFLIEYFILFATVAKITKIVSFFPIPIATIVKEKNTFKKSLVRKCLWLPSLAISWITLTGSTHKVTQPFGHVVLQDHEKTRTIIISLPQATKLGGTVT